MFYEAIILADVTIGRLFIRASIHLSYKVLYQAPSVGYILDCIDIDMHEWQVCMYGEVGAENWMKGKSEMS